MIEIAAAAIAALVPYLAKGGEKIAEEAGGSLFNWIKDKLTGKKKEKELEALQANPTDARQQGRLEAAIEDVIAGDEGLARELEVLTKAASFNVTHTGKGDIVMGDKVGGDKVSGNKTVIK